MYGYIYLTTNLINGKKYVGQHKSPEFDPRYKGSGFVLKQAFLKYGEDNFQTVLLKECTSREDLNQSEIEEISRRDAVNSKEYYNLSGGGEGWSSQWAREEFREMQHSKVQEFSEETREKLSISSKRRFEDPAEREKVSTQMKELQKDGGFMKGKSHTEATKRQMSESHKGKSPVYKDRDAWRASVGRDMHGDLNPMYGRSHSEDSKKVMSEKRTEHNKGCCWVNNNEVERFVKRDELETLLSQGYTRGRLHRPRKKKSSTTIESIAQEKDLSE